VSCEHGNDSFGSMKNEKFLKRLSYYQLLHGVGWGGR
jgi:hypothetical protein